MSKESLEIFNFAKTLKEKFMKKKKKDVESLLM